jgi:hypothetical protein
VVVTYHCNTNLRLHARSSTDTVTLREGSYVKRVDGHPHTHVLREKTDVVSVLNVQRQSQACQHESQTSKLTLYNLTVS